MCAFILGMNQNTGQLKNETSYDNLTFVVGDIRDKSRCLESIISFSANAYNFGISIKACGCL